MPDDYPRDAWDENANASNADEWANLLEKYDLDVDPRPNPARGPSFAAIARKHDIQVEKYKGVRLDKDIELTNRRQMREMLKLVDDAGLMRLVKAHIQFGNLKVPECYAIFNFTSAHQCPSLGFKHGKPDAASSSCQAFNKKNGKLICYAWGDELTYKGSFPYRTRQNELWRRVLRDDPEVMIETIKDVHRRYRNKKKPIVAIRWSEAGDLEDQKSLEAVYEISRAVSRLDVPKSIITTLKNDHEVPHSGRIFKAGDYEWDWVAGKFVSYMYTARRGLDFSQARRNKLVVMGSGRKSSGMYGTFKMVTSESMPPKQRGMQWGMCPMKCKICQRCALGLNTKVLNH